jgi:hypothetical protein
MVYHGEMIPYDLMAQYKLLQETARERIREIQMNEANHLKLLAQLMRFGVCPCVAMGRYSTCCGSTTDREAKPSAPLISLHPKGRR